MGNIKVSPRIYANADDKLESPNNVYPDPLYPQKKFVLSTKQSISVLVDVPVTTTMKAGQHTVKVLVKSAAAKTIAQTSFNFRVYPVQLPASDFFYTNWYHDVNYSQLNNGKPVQPFSEEYWSIFKNIVAFSKQHGQNVFTINPLYLITFSKQRFGIEANYTHFDRAVNIILNEVKMSYVLCRQFAARQGGWEAPFALITPQFFNSVDYMMVNKDIKDTSGTNFYSKFLPGYYKHITNKNWQNKILQHLADEPIAANKNSYIEVAKFLKKLAPGLKIVEAVHDLSVADYIDMPVYELGFYASNYNAVKKIQANPAKDVWLYTANQPRNNFANRFIELPAIKNRLLPWIAFRYGLKGYLHWSLNFWGDKPYEDASKVMFGEAVQEFPGGDAYVTYPGYRTIIGSIRFTAIRNGINDVALLTALRKKNPEAANRIAAQIVVDFDKYNTNSIYFFEKRSEILSLLSN